jgi:hypothetical protein
MIIRAMGGFRLYLPVTVLWRSGLPACGIASRAHANEYVRCNRNNFEGMLEELGFPIVDGLVSGMTFGEDLDAVSNLLPSEPRSNRFDRGNAANTIGKE